MPTECIIEQVREAVHAGDSERTLRLCRAFVAGDSNDDCADDGVLGEIHASMGSALLAEQQYEQACAAYVAAIDPYTRVVGHDSPHAAFCHVGVGMCLVRLERWREAETHLLQAEAYYAADEKRVCVEYGNCEVQLAILYRELTDYDKSERHAKRAVHVFAQAVGEESQHVAISLNHVGWAQQRFHGKQQAALGSYDRARSIWLALGDRGIEACKTDLCRGVCMRHLGRLRDAQVAIEAVLSELAEIVDTEHPTYVSAVAELRKAQGAEPRHNE